jgi:glycerophosphoryl diester phosphodiesterase
MSRLLLLGHRGARAVKSIPENTVASFDRALADGCDGFEFDVRLTSDGTAIVCHDSQIDEVEIACASAERLPRLPKLEDVLVRYAGSAFLDIELKVPGLEKVVAALLRKYAPQRGHVVTSFMPEVLRAMRDYDSGIPLGLICEKRSELRLWPQLLIEYVIPHYRLVSPELVQGIKDAGKRILVWTANSVVEMQRLRKLGVDGIISDKTDLLCRTLAGSR